MIRFLNLSVKDRAEYLEAIDRVLAHGILVNGPEVETFERQLADYCGTQYAIGCGSGTDALFLALKCLHIGPGHEVILPALGFVGTANVVKVLGAHPVFVDVGHDMLIDPIAAADAVTNRTAAIMAVHFTGNVCDMDALAEINVPIVEDAAPALGAAYKGRRAGTFGQIGCFSMNPMKTLGAFGEAGAVVFHDAEMLSLLQELRYHGIRNKETCVEPSLNLRLDTIQAAILSIKLRHVDMERTKRELIASLYDLELRDLVETPKPSIHTKHAWYTYTILCDRRDELAVWLRSHQIECKIYHPMLVPEHPAQIQSGEFPNASRIANRILCLPMHGKLAIKDIEKVCGVIKDFYK